MAKPRTAAPSTRRASVQVCTHGRRLCRSGNDGSGIHEWVLHVASASRREIRWTGPQQSAQGIILKTAVELAAAISRDQCPWIPPGPSAARPRVPSCSADGSPQGPPSRRVVQRQCSASTACTGRYWEPGSASTQPVAPRTGTAQHRSSAQLVLGLAAISTTAHSK